MSRARQLILESSDSSKPIGKRTRRRKGAIDPKRSAAAKRNWKANRASIIKGIRKFWASPEGKSLAKKLAAYRSRKESLEFNLTELQNFFEEEGMLDLVDFVETVQDSELDDFAELMEAAELMEELNVLDISEAVIKARKKRRVDPQRSKLMKLVRKRNKAAYAKGAKAAVKTKRSKGVYKALGKFNSKRASKEGEAISRARKFLEGAHVNENSKVDIAAVNFYDAYEDFKKAIPSDIAKTRKVRSALETIAEAYEIIAIELDDMDQY